MSPGQRSEIYHVLTPMATQLGLPAQKLDEYTVVFERHEVYTQKALYMLSEIQLKAIASECGMKIPAEQYMVNLWSQGSTNAMKQV